MLCQVGTRALLIIGSSFPDYSGLAFLFIVAIAAAAVGVVVFIRNLRAPQPWSRAAGVLLGALCLLLALLLLLLVADTALPGAVLVLVVLCIAGLAQVGVALFGRRR